MNQKTGQEPYTSSLTILGTLEPQEEEKHRLLAGSKFVLLDDRSGGIVVLYPSLHTNTDQAPAFIQAGKIVVSYHATVVPLSFDYFAD